MPLNFKKEKGKYMKRVISLLLAFIVITANGCIGFASAEGTLTVAQTGNENEYAVSYVVDGGYQVVIPPSGTTGYDKSTATMVVSANATLPNDKALLVYINRPAEGFVMSGTKGTVDYKVGSTWNVYTETFPTNTVPIGRINGGSSASTFSTTLTFAVTNPSAVQVGTYSQLITFKSDVIDLPNG